MLDTADGNADLIEADFYAGYIDGKYLSYIELEKRFPGKVVGISALGNAEALIQDTEAGNQGPRTAANIAHQRNAQGKPAIIYTNKSSVKTIPVVWADPLEWPKPRVYLWLADPTGDEHMVSDIDGIQPLATQYLWNGNSYDESVVLVNILDQTEHTVTPTPEPTPEPTEDKQDDNTEREEAPVNFPVTNPGDSVPDAPIACALSLPSGDAAVVTVTGSIYRFGNFPFHGSIATRGIQLNHPIVAAWCKDRNGYSFVDAMGKVYGFGDNADMEVK